MARPQYANCSISFKIKTQAKQMFSMLTSKNCFTRNHSFLVSNKKMKVNSVWGNNYYQTVLTRKIETLPL